MIITFIILLLLSNGLTIRRDLSILSSRISITILIYCIMSSYTSLYITYLDKGIGLFGGLFYASSITQIIHIFIFFITMIIMQLTSFSPRRAINEQTEINKLTSTRVIHEMSDQILEYSLIILFIVTGAILLLSSGDLVSIFLCIELQSYGLYLLCVLYRNSESATASGLTYFLLGGLSSCFILLGISLIYVNSGITNLESFYIITNLSINKLNSSNISNWYETDFVTYSLLLISVGLLFKIAAAPFHFWSPDVYDGIPTVVTTFVTLIAKLSITIVLIQLLHCIKTINTTSELNWSYTLTISSLLSLVIGTILGLSQKRIKRLLAYSTISHLGFILLAISINSIESTQAFLFYLIQYTVSNLNAFFILIAMGYSLYIYTSYDKEYNELEDKHNSPIQLIDQLKGYFYINPILAVSFSITLFSFAGIPPLVGFFGKQMVLSAAIDNGYVFLTLIGIITSVISAVYYLTIINKMFFDKPQYKKLFLYKDFNIILSGSLTITISVFSLLILAFIITPEQLLIMTNLLALINVSS